jgi:hypothetical protein
MSNEKAKHTATDTRERPSHRVRLPGFINEHDVGLGDLITRATSFVGIRPCGGCAKRAAALNRWFTFSGRHSR